MYHEWSTENSKEKRFQIVKMERNRQQNTDWFSIFHFSLEIPWNIINCVPWKVVTWVNSLVACAPSLVLISKLTNGNSIQKIHSQNPTLLKAMGYYPCHSNILYELQYCDPGGLNHSVPPDILHAILLGYFTRLINGFVQLKQINNDKLFVFSDSFLGEVERDLSSVGKALSQQSDPDLPKTHFPLIGYLPNPKKWRQWQWKEKCSWITWSTVDFAMFFATKWKTKDIRKPYWWRSSCRIC